METVANVENRERETDSRKKEQENDLFIRRMRREEHFVNRLASDKSDETPPLTQVILVDGKYKMLQKIASGAYGNVFKARDVHTDELCAVKAIKTKKTESPEIEKEIRVLYKILELDPSGLKSHVVKIRHAFSFHGHIFIAFELLGPSIRSILKDNGLKGFSLLETQEIGQQLVSGLQFLFDMGLVHHDIKPDNIVFTTPHFDWDSTLEIKIMRNTNVKLIDFGSATHITDKECRASSTLQYSSPEIMLKCFWNQNADVFSLGCTFYEIYTGSLLLPVAYEVDKCFLLETLFGKFPLNLGQRCSRLKCFNEDGSLKYDESTLVRVKNQHVKNSKFKERIAPFNKNVDTQQFFELVREMLILDADLRIQAHEILQHSFWKLKIKAAEQSKRDAAEEQGRDE